MTSPKPFKYNTIAVGGTFDVIHKGHEALLKRAFDTGERVVIGITSDRFAKDSGKAPLHDFPNRKKQMESYLSGQFPGRDYRITELDRTFGPGMFSNDIEALAVSSETEARVADANKRRGELGLPDLKVEVVPLVLAKDGKKISTTRIREGEIDESGR